MASQESSPRSLTQMLRESDDAAVSDLLVARPDLASPAPTTFSEVASRATTRESVRLALDDLDSVELWTAQLASVAGGPVSPSAIVGLLPEVASAALERLRRLALLWGEPDALRPVRALSTELLTAPLTAPPSAMPPAMGDVPHQPPDRVDSVAAGSAFELVRRMEVLLEHVDHVPVRLRQDGGLAQRESRSIGQLVDVSAADALDLATLARSAGLLGIVPSGRPDLLVPTTGFDTWQDLELSDQWACLHRGWVDHHGESGGPTLKQLCFDAFGPPGCGRVVGLDDLRRWLAWHRPRTFDMVARRAATMLRWTGRLGVTGLGALAGFGLGTELAALQRLLPARTEEILLQNDLTAVAPAPLTPQAAREIAALADVESHGGATVYRFTVESLRRARATGWSTARMQDVLERRSRTPVPQPLRYLIADLDRSRPAGPTGAMTGLVDPRPGARPPGPRGVPTLWHGDGPVPRIDWKTAAEIVARMRTSADPDEQPQERDLTPAEGFADSPLQTLREAVETRELVWVGYVAADGVPAERLVYADSVDDGLLRARASRTDDVVTLPVHRISAAHIIRGHSL